MKKKSVCPLLLCMMISLSACSYSIPELDFSSTSSVSAPASETEAPKETKAPKATFPHTQETETETESQLSVYDTIYSELSQFHTVVHFNNTVDTEEVSEAVNKIERTHPEIFWINGYVIHTNYVSAEITFKVIDDYNADELRRMSDELYAEVENIARTVNENASDYEKALQIHDYLVLHTEYDQEAVKYQDDKKGKGIWSTAYGCLINGLAVCQGYSQAFQILMERFGIECGICSGDAKGEAHAWNYIKLDNQYYWLDVTWDDPLSDNNNNWIHHDYFLIDDAMLSRSRTFDENNAFVPVCASLEENYFVRNQNYLTEYYFSEIDSLLTKYKEEGKIEVMFSTQEAYEMAMNDLFTSETVWNAQIFQETGGTINYQTDNEMCVLRLFFTVNE